jgi:hypothetical protein
MGCWSCSNCIVAVAGFPFASMRVLPSMVMADIAAPGHPVKNGSPPPLGIDPVTATPGVNATRTSARTFRTSVSDPTVSRVGSNTKVNCLAVVDGATIVDQLG